MKQALQINYDYTSAPTIQRFANSSAFFRGLMGPFGSGKSAGATIQLVRDGHAVMPMQDGVKRSRFGVIRNTYRQLRETTIKTVFDWIPPTRFGDYNKSEQTYKILAFPGIEIELVFIALDRPDQAENLLSLELTGAWVNEAREIPFEIIKPLMGRVGRYPSKREVAPGGYFGIIADTNPPDNDSWWYKFFETDDYAKLAVAWENKYFQKTGVKRSFREVFKQPGGLDPAAENIPNLEPGYYELLAADPDPAWVNVHVHAQYGFLKDGMPVYDAYRDDLHCRAVTFILSPQLVIYRGWDFGLTPACVFAIVDRAGRLKLIDELCATRAGADGFSDEVLTYSKLNYPGVRFRDIGDPAGNQSSQAKIEVSCFSILQGKGIEIEGGIQDLNTRIESVRFALGTLIDGEPALQVDPKAQLVRKGFQGGYVYKRKAISGEARYHDEPDKNKFSHPHDAVQYIAAELFGERVKEQRAHYSDTKERPQTVAAEDFDLFCDPSGPLEADDFSAWG